MSSYRRVKGYIGLAICAYAFIAAKFSYSVANACVIAVVIICAVIFYKSKNYSYLNCTKNMPRTLVINKYTLYNKYCIVKNFPNEKIIVMDNPLSKNHSSLRAFIVDKTNNEDVRLCWKNICSFYDEYTNLDALQSFIDKQSGRLSVIFLGKNSSQLSLEGMEEFIPKQPAKPKPATPKVEKVKKGPKLEEKMQNGQIVVEFDDFEKKEIKQEVKIDEKNHIVDMEELNTANKIDVNFADVQTISTLPGLNIIMAKKIVEYRNINGLFLSKEDFINVSGVKDHFKDKISSMIFIKKNNTEKKDVQSKERTVDL